MLFWRTYNSKLYTIDEVSSLGFSIDDPSYIPDKYLETKTFVIIRNAFGVGDWGIISALPRKLKEKYPDCKILVPTPKLLNNMFGQYKLNFTIY